MAGNSKNDSKERDWIIDLNVVTARERKAMLTDMTSGDVDKMGKWFARVVLKWPFEEDPTNPETYPNLGMAKYTEVELRFTELFPTAEKLFGKREQGS